MDMLSTTISRSMDTIPWSWDVVFSDVGGLLPIVAVCLTSIFCTALWLLAVSGYSSRGNVRTVC